METKYDELNSIITELRDAKSKNQSSFLTISCQRGMNISTALAKIRQNIESITNIKDKNNRQLAKEISQRAYDVLTKKFANQKQEKVYPNGVVAFFGETYSKGFIERIFYEDVPAVTKNIYDLSNSFDLSVVENWLNITGELNLMLYLDGTDFYQYKFDQNLNLVDTKHEKFCIINQKKVGGFSANRYRRLAEISRQNELTEVVELIRENFDDKIKNIYVCGIQPWIKKVQGELSEYQNMRKVLNQTAFVTDKSDFQLIKNKYKTDFIFNDEKKKLDHVDEVIQEYYLTPDKFAIGEEAIEQVNANNVQELCFVEEIAKIDRKTIENIPIVVCINQIKTGKQIALKQLGGIIARRYV